MTQNINSLESELSSKQNEIDRTKAENSLQAKELKRNIDELSDKLDRTRRELSDSEKDRASEKKEN